jgi:hypothetical protein
VELLQSNRPKSAIHRHDKVTSDVAKVGDQPKLGIAKETGPSDKLVQL